MVERGEIFRANLTVGLNQGQADAMMLITEFLSLKGPDMFRLRGYAGTGKTYLVKRVVEYIDEKYPGSKIAITAPTNKAVQVLLGRREFKSKSVTYQTIHSLLGLTETITSDGKVIFTNDKKSSGGLDKINYLIVDEVSMLQDDIFLLLQKHQLSSNLKIILMGDPAQIPPVGKTDCIPFRQCISKNYEEGYTLMEIMRQQKGNPIIETSFILRDNLSVDNPIPDLKTMRDDNDHGVIRVDALTERDYLLDLLETCFTSSKFKDNPDYAKVIAWRNRTVDMVNNRIRQMIYSQEENLTKIMKGEKLLANKPIFDSEQVIIYSTSEEFEIIDFKVQEKTLTRGPHTVKLKVYVCKVNEGAIKKGFNPTNTINIIHEDSEQDYKSFLEKLKERAISMKGMNKSWIDFYDMLKWPADIAYNYAITAHKSQGSTYENVFIMEDDINLNRNIVERNRIKYTAYSRASHKLYIYKNYEQS